MLDSDGGGEAAEEDSAGAKLVKDAGEHGFEMGFVVGEMEDGARDDEIERSIGEGHGLDGFAAEFFRGKAGDPLGILIDGADVVALADEVTDVAAFAAAGVEDFHAGLDAAAEQLIDEVDVGVAELLLERGHVFRELERIGRIADGARYIDHVKLSVLLGLAGFLLGGSFSLEAAVGLRVTELPDGRVGVAYSYQLEGSGGVAPYQYSLVSGNLAGLTLDSRGLVSGTPISPAPFGFANIRVQDATNASANVFISFRIRSVSVSFATLSFPAGVLGTGYIAQIAGRSDGSPPYRFSLASGSLPPGLQLSGFPGLEASISGLPSLAGVFAFSIRIEDSDGNSALGNFSIEIRSAAVLALTTGTLPRAALNQNYSAQLSASGGQVPFTFSLIGGSLPPGFTLSSSGLLSGTPTTATSYSFNVQVIDARGAVAQGLVTLQVTGEGLSFDLPYGNLKVGKPNQFYESYIGVRGGVLPYRYFVVGGSLPDGTSLGRDFQSLGYIRGVPFREGIFKFRMRIEDATNRNFLEADFVIQITSKDFGFVTTALPRAYLGQLYQHQILVEAGAEPYRFIYTDTFNQPIPIPKNPGLTLSQSGEIRGVPTTRGSWQVSIGVSDVYDNFITRRFEFRVDSSSLRFETTALPAGSTGQNYVASLRTVGQTGAVRYSLRSGSLGEGLSLSSNGEIRGVPQRAGTYSFVVEAIDSQGQTAQASLSLTITNQSLVVSDLGLPSGMVGQPYTATIAASGGVPPYVYALTSGGVAGLTLSSAGRLSGTPTQAGLFLLSVRITDSTGANITATVPLRIQSLVLPLQISSFAPPAGELHFNYQFAFSASGGRAPFRWRVAEGSLPNGTRLESDGLLRGVVAAVGTYRFLVEVLDANGTAARTLVTVAVPAARSLPRAFVGRPFAARLPGLLSGAALSANAFGNLPEGLRIEAGGEILGIPQVAGLYTFGVRGVNERGSIVSFGMNLRVDDATPGVGIETANLAGASVQSRYQQRLVASGGTGPYRWEVAGGKLPNGVSLNGEAIEGIPSVEGIYSVLIRVADSENKSAMRYYQVGVGPVGSPIVGAVTSAASYEGRGVVPGEVLALFGEGLGGRVLFDGVAATGLYNTSGQMGVVAPFGLEGRDSVRVVVENGGVQSAPVGLAVLEAKPAIFSANGSGQGAGAILNQDGGVNGEARRALPGQVVVLYVTGGGAMTPPGVDGQIAGRLSRLNAEVEVEVGGQKAEVVYAGNAPGLIEGVLQMNVVVPVGLPGGLADLKIRIGNETTKALVGVWLGTGN